MGTKTILFTYFIKGDRTQTAVINIIRIVYKLDILHASQHTFSKVTITII